MMGHIQPQSLSGGYILGLFCSSIRDDGTLFDRAEFVCVGQTGPPDLSGK